MKRILLFAGTADGRELLQRLRNDPVEITVSVATDYGAQLLEETDRIRVLQGRRDRLQMQHLLKDEAFALVVDATHPYAVEASRNIRAACEACNVPYIRLVRPQGDFSGAVCVDTPQEAVKYLSGKNGNILLTTGSKDLPCYTGIDRYQERVFPRILPDAAAVAKAVELGYDPGHIIAMQGPFSEELNLALIHQLSISYLVTKDGGEAAKFSEKLQAAKKAGITAIVIRRPVKEQGDTLEEVLVKIREEARK